MDDNIGVGMNGDLVNDNLIWQTGDMDVVDHKADVI